MIPATLSQGPTKRVRAWARKMNNLGKARSARARASTRALRASRCRGRMAPLTSWPPPTDSATRSKAPSSSEELALPRAQESEAAESPDVQNVRVVCVAIIGSLAVAAICTALGAGTLRYEGFAVRAPTAETAGAPTKAIAEGRNRAPAFTLNESRWEMAATPPEEEIEPVEEITPAARAEPDPAPRHRSRKKVAAPRGVGSAAAPGMLAHSWRIFAQ